MHSAGVVLLELFSRQRPYVGFSREQIKTLVCDKKRPTVPERVPVAVQGVIRDCLAHEAKSRPTSLEVLHRLRATRASLQAPQQWRLPTQLADSLVWVRDERCQDLHFAQLDEKNPAHAAILASVKTRCAGVNVTRVLAIRNQALLDGFEAHLKSLQTRCRASSFGAGHRAFEQKGIPHVILRCQMGSC